MQDNGTRVRERRRPASSTRSSAATASAATSTAPTRQLMLGSLYYDDIRKSTNGGTRPGPARATGIAEKGNSRPRRRSSRASSPGRARRRRATRSTRSRTPRSTSRPTTPARGRALPDRPVTTSGRHPQHRRRGGHANIIGVVASGGRVFLSNNGGTTWTLVATGDGKARRSRPRCPTATCSLSVHPLRRLQRQHRLRRVGRAERDGQPPVEVDRLRRAPGRRSTATACPPACRSTSSRAIRLRPAGAPGQVLYAGTAPRRLPLAPTAAGPGAASARACRSSACTDLYISPDESIVRAATYGRGFWQLDTAGHQRLLDQRQPDDASRSCRGRAARRASRRRSPPAARRRWR